MHKHSAVLYVKNSIGILHFVTEVSVFPSKILCNVSISIVHLNYFTAGLTSMAPVFSWMTKNGSRKLFTIELKNAITFDGNLVPTYNFYFAWNISQLKMLKLAWQLVRQLSHNIHKLSLYHLMSAQFSNNRHIILA